MKVVFRDSAEEIPMPGSAREVLPFLRVLWLWEVNFFWYLALSFEMMLLFFLGEKFPALGRNKLFLQRLISLLACCKCLADEMDCDIHFGSDAAFFKRMPKGVWKRARWVFIFAWGWALLGEGFMWQYISNHFIRNERLRERIIIRSLSVSITGANMLTDGWLFPWIEMPGWARSGAQEAEKNKEEQ